MSGQGSLDLVSYARELERQDVDVAARIETVTALLDRVDAVRAGARRVTAELELSPLRWPSPSRGSGTP